MRNSTDTIAFWHQHAARAPLLTTAQEIALGRSIQAWLTAEDPNRQIIRRGKKAKDRMIQSNLKLVISVCKKYSKRITRSANLEVVDLYQEGVIGLNRAAEKFNPESGYKFSTYAFWWISQAVRRVIETQVNTIRMSNIATQIYFRWKYKPEGQTLEQFAEAEGKPISYVKGYLEAHQRAQVRSLDCVLKGNGKENSVLMDCISTGESDENSEEYVDVLNELQQIPEIKDSLAILELSQEAKSTELAPLLDCSAMGVKKALKDHQANVREHCPNDLRRRLNVKELNPCVRLINNVPSVEVSPMPETISSNGHCTSLEAEAIAVINEVQTEEPAKPPRKRRTSAEVAAAGTVALKINGMDMQGTAADVAAVLKAYSV